MARQPNIDALPEAAIRLRSAREARGFKTQEAACSFFGWKINTYRQHENGLRPFHRSVERYAKALKVSAGWLLTGDGPAIGMRSVDGELAHLPIGDREELYEQFLFQIDRRVERYRNKS